jgi:hypothetical protein
MPDLPVSILTVTRAAALGCAAIAAAQQLDLILVSRILQ